jgi:diaminohydroxyphosphoribosylaminopyrimidine deaminase/5-amino-6-(5-phosphoribosylamino)uracil reductase
VLTVDLLTALSVNGLITGERGHCGHELEAVLGTPREILEHKYVLRRRYGALLVGTDTVVVDNPSLASHAAPGHPAVRATLDRTGRIPRTHRFFDGSARTLVGVCRQTPRAYRDFLDGRGVEAVEAGDAQIDLAGFLAGLAARGIRSVACEGGGRLNRSLLAAGLVRGLHLLVLPVVLDAASVNLFEGPFAGSRAPVRLRLVGQERQGEYLWLEYAVY